jgi:hypothetical protein
MEEMINAYKILYSNHEERISFGRQRSAWR